MDPPRPLRLRTDSGSAGSPRKRWLGEPSEGFRPRSCESRLRGARLARVVSGRGSRLAGVFGPPGLAPGGPRHSVHGTRRQDDGSELDAPAASAVAASVSPARVRQEDLEGERSPGRTVLASFPVSNPERTARTRRWSKALKRPTLPGRAVFDVFHPQGWGIPHAAAPGGPIDAWGNSRRLRSSWRPPGGCVEVGRAIGRPEPIGSAGASGVSVRLRKRLGGARRSVEPQEVQRPR
jgi:hypothetical protein